MSKPRVVFRADGNVQIGLGHVTRSLALADMLEGHFTRVFATQDPSPEVEKQIARVCEGIIRLPQTPHYEEEARQIGQQLAPDDVVVLDGYHFGTSYQQVLKQAGHQLVCIDDVHAYHFVADVIINQAGGVEPGTYSKELYTRLLLGPPYALLRRPFLTAARAVHSSLALKSVFVNFGGADPANATQDTINQLVGIGFFEEIIVLVGDAYPYFEELSTFCKRYPQINVYRNLDARGVVALMQRSGMAICSPSGVAYEYCSVGGLLFLRFTADNQKSLAHFLVSAGAACLYGDLIKVLDEGKPDALAGQVMNRQRLYFTGKTTDKYVNLFNNLVLASRISVHKAGPDDVLTLYRWANDPEVRHFSFNPNAISLENHKRWFARKLEDPKATIFLLTLAGEPLGQIRFEAENHTAVISYLIDGKYRGKGLGVLVLLAGVQAMKAEKGSITQFIGYVKKDNIASRKAFEKAGFTEVSAPHLPYPNSYLYQLPA